MTDYTHYAGKPIADLDLWELGKILNRLNEAEARRDAAAKHAKFNVDREIQGKKVLKMDFPPPNPEFSKLKNAIELEIKRKQSNV